MWNLTDEDCPDIDENEERDISKLLKREDEWEHVVWHTLCKPIQRMKRMAGIWGWHDPLVMGLVQRLVDFRMVQAPVNPVDAQVRKADKQGELHNVVQRKGSIRRSVIKFAVTAHFGKETRGREEGHYWHGDHGLANLERHLVLQIFRVSEGGVIKDEEVGEGGADEIEDKAKEPVRVLDSS